MSFLEEIQMLGERVKKTVQLIQTEEATKQAFVIPFIKMLGYDVYDPTEVVPEYIADIGIENGGKIDYAVMREGKPEILVECKWCGIDINNRHAIQLYRYFPGTPARIALLTNGVIFRFFTGVEKPNQMDSKPFLEIDLRDIQESSVSELEKLTKSHFDLDALISASAEQEPVSEATESKYGLDISKWMSKQLLNPSDEFVKFLTTQLHSVRVTQNTLEQLRGITKDALGECINSEIAKRLKLVLENLEGSSSDTFDQNSTISSTKPSQRKTNAANKPSRSDILSGRSRYQNKHANITLDKIQAFKNVRNAVKEVVDIKRVFYRDSGNYFTVILDDNRRKPICHLRIGPRKKHVIFFDQGERQEKVDISTLDDINNFVERLQAIVLYYKEEK